MKVNVKICPECGQPHPDDDRVKAGMRCRFCAYGEEVKQNDRE